MSPPLQRSTNRIIVLLTNDCLQFDENISGTGISRSLLTWNALEALD
jgi:hypothetical protein